MRTAIGTGVFNGGGIGALRGYDALSAIPDYLGIPNPPADEGAGRKGGGDDAVGTGGGASRCSGGRHHRSRSTTKPKKNGVVIRRKFSPAGLPVLFGSGGGKNAADNGIRGYGDALKKLGLNGGPESPPSPPRMPTAATPAPTSNPPRIGRSS